MLAAIFNGRRLKPRILIQRPTPEVKLAPKARGNVAANLRNRLWFVEEIIDGL